MGKTGVWGPGPTLCLYIHTLDPELCPPPRSRKPSAAPIIILAQLIPAPLGLADSQPQSDLTRSRRRHASSCQLNGQVACLLKHKSRIPEACWSQETNTGNCLHGVAKRAGAHSFRLITKSTGKEENLIEAKAMFLHSKGARLPPQGQSTLLLSQTQIENYINAIKYNHPHTICWYVPRMHTLELVF